MGIIYYLVLENFLDKVMLKNRNDIKHERHPFHIVDPSPWPIMTSGAILSLVLGLLIFWGNDHNLLNFLITRCSFLNMSISEYIFYAGYFIFIYSFLYFLLFI